VVEVEEGPQISLVTGNFRWFWRWRQSRHLEELVDQEIHLQLVHLKEIMVDLDNTSSSGGGGGATAAGSPNGTINVQPNGGMVQEQQVLELMQHQLQELVVEEVVELQDLTAPKVDQVVVEMQKERWLSGTAWNS
jgi:hypothetical protein